MSTSIAVRREMKRSVVLDGLLWEGARERAI